MKRNSLAFRLVASAAIWCAVLLSLGGFALSRLFADTVERNFDARLRVLLEGVVAGSELTDDGRLVLRPQLGEPRFEQPLSGWYWQIDGADGPLRRSASLWDEALPAVPAVGGKGVTLYLVGPEGEPLRALSRRSIRPRVPRPLMIPRWIFVSTAPRSSWWTTRAIRESCWRRSSNGVVAMWCDAGRRVKRSRCWKTGPSR